MQAGDRYGLWMVLEPDVGRNASKVVLAACRCDCGTERAVEARALRRGASRSCGCTRHGRGAESVNWQGIGSVPKAAYTKARDAAGRRRQGDGIPWRVTHRYLAELYDQQGGRCALTGWPIGFEAADHTASLDRIDSGRGYTPGNVQWVHKEANLAKGPMGEGRFVELCRAVVEHAAHGLTGEVAPTMQAGGAS